MFIATATATPDITKCKVINLCWSYLIAQKHSLSLPPPLSELKCYISKIYTHFPLIQDVPYGNSKDVFTTTGSENVTVF